MVYLVIRAAIITFISATVACAPAIAQTSEESPAPDESPAPSSSTWHYSVTPYLWVPNVNGTLTLQHPALSRLGVPASTVDLGVHVGPNKYLAHLNFAAMFAADANDGVFDVFTDVISLRVSSTTSGITSVTGPGGRVEIPINTSGSTRLSSLIWTLGLGYTVMRRGKTDVELFAGSRLANIRPSVDWDFSGPLDILSKSGSASKNVTLWSPIFGFRGRIGLGGNFFVPYYGDFGWGDKFSTYQGFIGAGYSFRHGQSLVLVNRWMGYNMDNGPLNYVQFVGPTLGYQIPFQ